MSRVVRTREALVFAVWLSMAVVVGCSTAQTNVEAIYHGGPILTMEGDTPQYVEALAVEDGRIVFVGEKAYALALRGEETRIEAVAGNYDDLFLLMEPGDRKIIPN
jgi:hypothetical protein